MASFVLIPGAGGVAWYWHRIVPLLQASGHRAVAVDLPGADKQAGLDVYAATVVAACGKTPPVLVAQSMGGFTAPLVCEQIPVQALVLVNAMIPNPGETPGAWWGNTGAGQARVEAATRDGYSTEFDLHTYFLHDVPPDVAQAGAPYQREEAEIAFTQPCAFRTWPQIPTHVVAGEHDRFFPADFQQRVARERLNREINLVPGGHLCALSYPKELAAQLLTYLPRHSP